MKKTTSLLSMFLLIIVSCLAQEGDELLKKEKFDDNVITRLKATQTVFFLKEKAPGVDLIKSALKEGWKLTPLIFDDIRNFDNYGSDPKYSYFVIEGDRLTSRSGGSSTNFYITLRSFDKVGRKNMIKTIGLSRIELHPDFKTARTSFLGKQEELINSLYEDAVFYNWSPIGLKANLQAVETNLKNALRPDMNDDIKSANLTQLISNDTLYVPQRQLMSFSGLTGEEHAKEDNVFEKYRYKYRICSDAELYNIFQVQKRGRLLFEYVRSSSVKYMTVFDMKEGKVIYKHSVGMTYNLKSKDIERIK